MRAREPSCVTLFHYLPCDHPQRPGVTPHVTPPQAPSLSLTIIPRATPLNINAKGPATLTFQPGSQAPTQVYAPSPILKLTITPGAEALAPARLPHEASTLTVQVVPRSPESDAIPNAVTTGGPELSRSCGANPETRRERRSPGSHSLPRLPLRAHARLCIPPTHVHAVAGKGCAGALGPSGPSLP